MIIFGANMSSSVHADNEKILGKGQCKSKTILC